MADDTDRANALMKRILDSAKEARNQGVKVEPFATASAAILAGQLVKSLDRIDRLESDIESLTAMVADLEASR